MALSLPVVGEKFGKWTIDTVIGVVAGNTYVMCHCDCGRVSRKQYTLLCRKRTLGCTSCAKRGNTYSRLPYGEANFNQIYSGYKRQAIQRGKEWALSRETARSLFGGECHYCGEKPSQISGANRKDRNGLYTYNGIDRTDSSKGYTVDNVVTACGRCNKAKLDMSLTDFLVMIRKIYTRHCLSQASTS